MGFGGVWRVWAGVGGTDDAEGGRWPAVSAASALPGAVGSARGARAARRRDAANTRDGPENKPHGPAMRARWHAHGSAVRRRLAAQGSVAADRFQVRGGRSLRSGLPEPDVAATSRRARQRARFPG